MAMSIHELDQSQYDTDELLHDRADAFVASLDRGERVTWLKRHGLSDLEILEALLDPDDADLDELTRERAHQVAADVANGSIDIAPAWLR